MSEQGSAPAAISTWFVADDAANATFFPQIGCRSDAPGAQAVYWRCTVAFFASSLAVNPDCRHVFFTNTQLPLVDGLDVNEVLTRWGVEIVHLPITWRLPPRSVSSWGNQFYVFDVIEWWAANGPGMPLLILDSDCIWTRPVDPILAAIAEHGAITYELGDDEHRTGLPINGLSREKMARFLERHGGPALPTTPYFGGEIVGATKDVCARVAARARALWPGVAAQAPDSPREEAHLLSIIYALEGIAPGTANGFIRRMWTTFHHNNVTAADKDLAIWHLPAEKRTGFADLFGCIAAQAELDPRERGADMGLDVRTYARLMGVPMRGPRKFVRDLSLKLREKLLGQP